MIQGVALIEKGKLERSQLKLDQGIEKLENARALLNKQHRPLLQIERMIALSKKIKSLKEIDEAREGFEVDNKRLNKEMSTLAILRLAYDKKIDDPNDQVDGASNREYA